MKVSDLTGARLDYWVAVAAGARAKMSDSNERGLCLVLEIDEEHGDGAAWFPFSPSTDWAQGGPIIERARISIRASSYGFRAYMHTRGEGPIYMAETPLIAAMRAYVCSKFGDEVLE